MGECGRLFMALGHDKCDRSTCHQGLGIELGAVVGQWLGSGHDAKVPILGQNNHFVAILLK